MRPVVASPSMSPKTKTPREKSKLREIMRNELDQLRVQLAGCLAVAQGATDLGNIAKPGEFGWSPAYQAVLELRLRLEGRERPASIPCGACEGSGRVTLDTFLPMGREP